ncbi:hypothetical protein [Aquabacterium sp. J223]|nr:hypothetical protein [Aquabacterium sp. J223]UUX94712.1 hypothetical protein LRS07_15685 [Aquabacterium sp. J223]
MNRQQLELLDRTILGGAAPDRAALLLRALREHARPSPAPAIAAPAKEPR